MYNNVIWIFLFFFLEKQTWYFVGWRRSASSADPFFAVLTFRVALTHWHISTAGAKRVDLQTMYGMVPYMTGVRCAWKSFFLYSVTLTVTPNYGEKEMKRWAHIFFFLHKDVVDCLTSWVCFAAPVSHMTGAFKYIRRVLKKLRIHWWSR